MNHLNSKELPHFLFYTTLNYKSSYKAEEPSRLYESYVHYYYVKNNQQ